MRGRTARVNPLPRWVAGLGAVALAYLVLPLVFMCARVDWGGFAASLSRPEALDAITLSLSTVLAALAIDLVLGVPAALLLARSWRGARLARIAVALPLSLPPVVAGIALLAAFGRKSLIGHSLEVAGIDIAFTTVAVVMAQVFVSLPFLIVTLESAIRSRPQGLEEAAVTLGASPLYVLRRITLPMVTPGLLRGSALALARCLGEFGATLTFAGSLQGVTRTMPLQIYLARESDSDLALSLGVVLLLVALVVVGVTEIPARSRTAHDADEVASATWPETPQGSLPRALTSAAGVSLAVRGEVPQRGWAVDLEFPAGTVTAVMGRNGSGKSTLAHVVAGLVPLGAGAVRIGDRPVDSERAFVPPSGRHVGLITQQAHVFPHLTVVENVAFPLRARGIPRAQAREQAIELLEAMGCRHLASSRGGELSGGQAALVSVARVLASDPEILILDEPTAALDVRTAASIRALVTEILHHTELTTLLITHDPLEALACAAHSLILEDGHVVESGTPTSILTSPTTVFGAHLAGLNVITGQAVAAGPGLVGVRAGDAMLCAAAETHGTRIALLFAPESVALARRAPEGSPRNVFSAQLASSESLGSVVTARLIVGSTHIDARVTTAAWSELAASPGDTLWCAVKATQVRVIDLPER